MEIRKLQTAVTVGAGTIVYLNKSQANARSHLIAETDGKAVGKGKEKRDPYKALQLLNFKSGEELGIADKLDRHQERAFGLSPEAGGEGTDGNDDDLAALIKAKADAERAKADADKAKADADTAKADAEKAKAEADEALEKLRAAQAAANDPSTNDDQSAKGAEAKKGDASNEAQNQTS